MKQHMQGMVMGVLVTVLLLGTATIFAATPQTIEVVFGNVRTTLFGQEFVVRDSQGLVIEPLTYNGRVYVPVETVLHAMGQNVQWDAYAGILNFGTTAQQPPNLERRTLNSAAPFYDRGSVGSGEVPRIAEFVMMGGVEYLDAIVFSRQHHLSGFRHNSFTLHNLNGQFTTLSGYFGRVDGSGSVDVILNIFGDGRLLQELSVRAGDLPIPISVSVEGVRLLRIEVVYPHAPNPSTQYGLVGFLQ